MDCWALPLAQHPATIAGCFLLHQGMSVTFPTPVILARAEHPVSRKQISKTALRVLYKLLQHDHEAYLVGGGVRDLLLGREPKDFDVATSAHPERIKALFKSHCRLIGRRFVLAHVQFGPEIIEVATFRALDNNGKGRRAQTREGLLVSDNVYGTLPEDALRRDFTINALYYNPDDFTVLDFHGGIQDLHHGLIRVIGDPETRFREDPVRMLRAVRFAAKLGFRIEPHCEAVMQQLTALLQAVPPARLYDESQKLLLNGFSLEAFEKLRHYGLFAPLFPEVEASLTRQQADFPLTLVARGLDWLDQQGRAGVIMPPYWLLALLWWEPVQQLVGTEAKWQALVDASQLLLTRQSRAQAVGIPARVGDEMRNLWLTQWRLAHPPKNPQNLLGHPLFAQAWQFLALRAQAGEVDTELVAWWQAIATASPAGRQAMARMQTEAMLQGYPEAAADVPPTEDFETPPP